MPSPSQTDRTFIVKILKVTRRASGTIRATVDVQVGSSLKLLGCKIVQQANQRPWVAMPAREWVDASGQKKYAPTVELLGNLKAAVERAILAECEGGER
jgi:DNA-binding cell septation regulator SpoVG